MRTRARSVYRHVDLRPASVGRRRRKQPLNHCQERGLVLSFEGTGTTADREEVRELCGGEVAYVNYSRGDSAGHVRFKSVEAAKEVRSLPLRDLRVWRVWLPARTLDGRRSPRPK